MGGRETLPAAHHAARAAGKAGAAGILSSPAVWTADRVGGMFRGSMALSAALILILAGCSAGGTTTSARQQGSYSSPSATSPQSGGPSHDGGAYDSTDEIEAALAKAGYACENALPGDSINGAIESSTCFSPGTSQFDTQIVVFGGHATASAYAAGAVIAPYGLVTRTTALVGRNWVLTTTSPAYAQAAQHALGGSILLPRPQSSPTAASSPVNQQVDYQCAGNAPDGVAITYGAEGFYYSASRLPFEHTDPLDPSAPNYYYISARLEGGGSVSCSTTVTYDDSTGAKTVAVQKASANGGQNSAKATVCSNPFGGWDPC